MKPLATTLSFAALALFAVDLRWPFARRVADTVEAMRQGRAHRVHAARAWVPLPEDTASRQPWRVAEEGDVSHVVVHSVRFDLRGESVTTASDAPDEPIADAVRVERGWVFVTHGGGVYASESFSGRLRALGPEVLCPGEHLVRVQRSFGRAVIHGRGGLYETDGATLVRIDEEGVNARAWQSPTHGAMIVRHRTIRVTEDGGRTWRDSALTNDRDVAIDLLGRSDGVFAYTTRGWHKLDLGGAAPIPVDRAEVFARERGWAPSAELSQRLVHEASRSFTRVFAVSRECNQDTHVETPPSGASATSEVAPPLAEVTEGEPEVPVVPAGRAAPLGAGAVQSHGRTGDGAAVLAANHRGRDALFARGEDDDGSFVLNAIGASRPGDRPLVATRRGVLVAREARVFLGPLEWLGATGSRAIAAPLDLIATAAVGFARRDGGAVVSVDLSRPAVGVTTSPLHTPYEDAVTVRWLIELSPAGEVRHERFLVPDDAPGVFVGLGERDARVGFVTARRDDANEMTFLPIEGPDEPFGRWDVATVPAPCASSRASVKLHTFRGFGAIDAFPHRITVTVGGAEVDFARPAHAVYGLSDAATCLRGVWGTLDNSTGVVRVNARGGRLVGTYDDGRHVAPLDPVTVHAQGTAP